MQISQWAFTNRVILPELASRQQIGFNNFSYFNHNPSCLAFEMKQSLMDLYLANYIHGSPRAHTFPLKRE